MNQIDLTKFSDCVMWCASRARRFEASVAPPNSCCL